MGESFTRVEGERRLATGTDAGEQNRLKKSLDEQIEKLKQDVEKYTSKLTSLKTVRSLHTGDA